MKKAKHLGAQRRLYSYIRFSTPEQSLGDSVRRQMEAARAYAEKHGFIFDEQLRDEGLSGWSGKNRTKGALGRFLDRVESGSVQPNSVLFVEDLDRLSREGMVDALRTIVFGLIEKGITIATSSGVYDRATLNSNSGAIWLLIAKIQTAHEESQKKSERLGSVWAQKKREARESGKVVTSRCPRWLRVESGKFIQIPEAVKTVRMIFSLVGSIGRSHLVKKLNAEAPWRPPGRKKDAAGNGWRMSYVRKIITNRAVLGELQLFTQRGAQKRKPDGAPIPGYYPQIIDEKLFNATQRRLERNKAINKGGRTGLARNLFMHLAKCAYCGGPMVFQDKGPPPKGGQYLVCDNAVRGVACATHSISYREFEDTILNNSEDLRPVQVLPDEAQAASRCVELRLQADNLEQELSLNRKKYERLLDIAGLTKNDAATKRIAERMDELSRKEADLQRELMAAQEALRSEENAQTRLKIWQKDLGTLRKAIRPKKAVEVRLRLSSHLREFIAKVEIFGRGYATRYDPDDSKADEEYSDMLMEHIEAEVAEFNLPIPSEEEFRRFLDFVSQLRLSKEGRFFRIHFLPRGYVNVVPNGSLGSGAKFSRDGSSGNWQGVRPDWTELWKRFKANRGRRATTRVRRGKKQ